MNTKKRTLVISVLLLTITVLSWGNTLYIFAKAQLAQYLIASAWSHTLEDQNTHTPWSWADTWPVARLRSTEHNQDLYVLAGASGSSLAFGPGHLDGSAQPGQLGSTVIGGHRDTHFGFLERLEPGNYVELQTVSGVWHRYKIINTGIKNSETEKLIPSMHGSELILVTCYPFDSIIPGGPLRYVVRAELQINRARVLEKLTSDIRSKS